MFYSVATFSIMWTPLHAALGEASSPLTYDLFERSVAQGVRETDALDWKEKLPGTNAALREEFAKDVAAMANTRGGMIVYGMAEDRGTGSAKEIKPVDTGEQVRRQLAAIAASNIQPFVSGLSFLPVDQPTHDGSGLLVLSVPQSVDAPHLIGQQQRLGVPFRDGPETRWMRERDLERAYRERFERRADEHARLREEFDDVRTRLDIDGPMWIVAVAVPRTPRPAVLAPIQRSEVTEVLNAALGTAHNLTNQSTFGRTEVIKLVGADSANNPRIGLRRWIIAQRITGTHEELSKYTHIELHHDGSVALASQTEGWYDQTNLPEANALPVSHAESLIADLVALLDAVSRHSGAQTSYAIRIDLVRQDISKPVIPVDQRTFGGVILANLEVPLGARQIRAFRPVLNDLRVPADDDELRASAREIASDVLAQLGIGRLHLFGSG